MRRNLKYISLLLTIMLILVGVVGCAQDDADTIQDIKEPNIQDDNLDKVKTEGFPLEIEDTFGNVVSIEKVPERIISMAPSNTEILYALGLGDKIVGVTAYCDYPEGALAVEKIGDSNGINFEKVLELEPDLIVNYGKLDTDASQIYSNAGIPVISFLPESIDEVIGAIKIIAIATDAVEEGNALVDSMIQKRDEIVAKVQNTEMVRVFYEVWHEPLMTAGTGSFVDNLINLANGSSVYPNIPFNSFSLASFNSLFTSSAVVDFSTSNTTSTIETVATGTLTENPFSLPLNSGNTNATALAAPVVVGTIFCAAALARLKSLCLLSNSCWSFV
jgi:iron complex transport system substrate-binding protein